MIAKMEENIGDKTQASKWKDLASWGPLGNEQVRLDFAYALGKRNYVDDALVQFDLVSKTGEPGSYSVGASSRAIASKLIEKRALKKLPTVMNLLCFDA